MIYLISQTFSTAGDTEAVSAVSGDGATAASGANEDFVVVGEVDQVRCVTLLANISSSYCLIQAHVHQNDRIIVATPDSNFVLPFSRKRSKLPVISKHVRSDMGSAHYIVSHKNFEPDGPAKQPLM